MARPARTRATLTQVPDILLRLRQCRELGYATNCEELFLGDMGIAAPIRSMRGQVVGAVHIAPPTSRWTMPLAQAELSALVVECAQAISSLATH